MKNRAQANNLDIGKPHDLQSMTSAGTYGQKQTHQFLENMSYFSLRRNVKTILVTNEEEDWIFNLNIGNVMHLQPLSSEEMNLYADNTHELSRDALMEKIILLTVSYFCVGTELRFLNNNITPEEIAKQTKETQGEMESEKKQKKE